MATLVFLEKVPLKFMWMWTGCPRIGGRGVIADGGDFLEKAAELAFFFLFP